MDHVPPSLPDPSALSRAAVANAAIRTFWVAVGGRDLTAAEWVEHARLQQAWADAVAGLNGAEGEEPALAA